MNREVPEFFVDGDNVNTIDRHEGTGVVGSSVQHVNGCKAVTNGVDGFDDSILNMPVGCSRRSLCQTD